MVTVRDEPLVYGGRLRKSRKKKLTALPARKKNIKKTNSSAGWLGKN